jgi:hypothetical protein
MMKYCALILLVSLLSACVPVGQSSSISGSNPKTLRLADYAYEQEIKTIQLHPNAGLEADLMPAVTKLGTWNLILEFDDLRSQRDNYYARIIHCNHDWTKSTLMDLDFMTDYNEFNVTDYHVSIDTHIPYIHYTFNLPAVKLPGNYVVIVYRAGDKDDLVLSKRFMVYDPRISFVKDGNLITSGKAARLNQQINFTISYKNIDIPNPMENVWVVIRQNQRWDNLATDIKPSFIRDFERELEYRFFDDQKLFKGGNEFRFFDLRSLNYPGRNVQNVSKQTKPYEAFIQKDKPRSDEVYSQYKDLDGNFFITNLDYNDIDFTNYVYVNFQLTAPRINGNVYVTGAFNYWNLNKENQMRYDTVNNEYTARFLLKQGWYDYQYAVKSSSLPAYYFEGTHFETQNSYEIFVYYKANQLRAEHLIGYIKLDENPR